LRKLPAHLIQHAGRVEADGLRVHPDGRTRVNTGGDILIELFVDGRHRSQRKPGAAHELGDAQPSVLARLAEKRRHAPSIGTAAGRVYSAERDLLRAVAVELRVLS